METTDHMDIDNSSTLIRSISNKSVLNNYPEFLNQCEWPFTRSLDEFLDYPTMVRPKPDQVNEFFSEDDTLLTHAIRQQNIKAVLGLLVAGADSNLLNRKGVTPISVAAHKGKVEIILALIEFGSNVNALNATGSTALIQASHFGNLEAVRLLLKHNALSDFANLKGTTALMRASQEGHVEISKLLIEYLADVNRKNHEGMNALMLASQRGHGDMVMLLIKSGAMMDEQTSQGSTALMLACKRGHQMCVEVLVTMGAEIYIRDCRSRTARDTAAKRNHIPLLYWLDTQVQVQKMQEYRRNQRTYHLLEMRKAFAVNKLQLNPVDAQLINILETFYFPNQQSEQREDMNVSSRIRFDAMPSVSTFNNVDNSLISETETSTAVINRNWPSNMKKRYPNYYDWQWSKLLFRSFYLPLGVFDLIVEYLPLPRVWLWSIWRINKRCKLAPQVAISDISHIIDEILCDSNIFNYQNQKMLLMRINNDSQVQERLISNWNMNVTLLKDITLWADLQSLSSRVTEAEVSFKPKIAKNYLEIVSSLHKWYRNQVIPTKALQHLRESKQIREIYSPAGEYIGFERYTVNGEFNHSHLKREVGMVDNDADIIETTDIGVEDDISDDGDIDDIAMDQETENEMAVDGDNDNDDQDDYVDSDGDLDEFHAVQMMGLPYNYPSL